MSKLHSSTQKLPWYRYGIAWLVVVLPLIAVAASLTTLYIAIENQPQVKAIREALVNLLIHSDYFSPMKPRIRAFSNGA